MNQKNEWKDIRGYEGLYRVNKDGEIYSLTSKKILKPFWRGSRSDNKYLVVDLHKNKKGHNVSVHRLVAEAFIPNPENLPCVNHKDGNKYNNNADNLEWCTYSRNNYHAFEHGLKVIPDGTKSKLSKLAYDDVVEIKKCLILGDPEYGTRPLGKKYGVDHTVISDVYHDVKYKDVKVPYTFFVCSDIHSAYIPWMEALNKAGFNPNKYTHKIVVCGDLFDRMDESIQVYNFVKDMLEKDKLIYVKGNHESLMEDCLSRGFAHSYDISNGTEKSIIDLAPNAQNFYEACTIVYEKMKPLLSKTVNYFETKNYIFAHSFVPLKNLDGKPMHYTRNRKFAIDPDWRHAHASAWEEARWGNPFELAKEGFLPDKTLVFGHWGTYDQRPYDYYDGDDLFDPIYGDGYIGIDGTTALSGQVNVVIIEDEFMEEE